MGVFVIGLVSHYTEDHEDLSTCEGALRALNPLAHDIERSLSMSEQRVKLIELSRDLIGLPPPLLPEGGSSQRQFILEGCLQKLSRDGYHQRMFFLVSPFTFIPHPLTWLVIISFTLVSADVDCGK